MRLAMISERLGLRLIAVMLCFLFLFAGCMRFSKQKPGEQPDLSKPMDSFYSAPLDRLSSGFANILTGPCELVYQFKEEIKRTDPIRGTLPGVIKGVTWFAVREVVGVFEIATFFIPWKPHLHPFDTEWISL